MVRHSCMGLVVCLAWTCVASADPPADAPHPCNLRQWLWTRFCPPSGCCPNDYDHKPCPPLVPVQRCGGVDDYCRKPLPCVPTVPRCGGADDYCRKPLPTLLCPPASPYLQCGPANQCAPMCGKRN